MSKDKFSFAATGRKLFPAEKVAAKLFEAKYGPSASALSDHDARAKMAKVHVSAQSSLRQGKAPTTGFFAEVTRAQKSTTLAARVLATRKTSTAQKTLAASALAQHGKKSEKILASKSGPGLQKPPAGVRLPPPPPRVMKKA